MEKNGIENIDARFRGLCCMNMLWIALYALGLGFYLILTPPYMDDIWYMEYLQPWYAAQGIAYPSNGGNILTHGIPWSEILETWQYHDISDNRRLANLLAPVLLLFPKWFGSALITLAWLRCLRLGFGIAGIDWRRSVMVPLFLFMATFMVPWSEHMGILDYQLNYVLSTWLALELWNMLQKKGDDYVRSLICLLLGFIGGMVHEAVSAPMLCGLVGLMILNRSCRTKQYFLGCIGLAAALLVLFTSVGMTHRVDVEISKIRIIHPIRFLRMDFLPLPVFWLLAFFFMLKGREARKRLMSDRWLVFCAATSVASFVVAYHSGYLGRGYFWMDVACIIGAVRLLHLMGAERRRVLWIVASVPMLGLMLWRWVTVDVETVRFRNEINGLAEWYVSGKPGSYFGDYRTVDKRPLIAGYFPEYCDYHEFASVYLRRYLRNFDESDMRRAVIIPEALRYADSTADRRLGGRLGARMREGYIYMPYDPEFSEPICYFSVDFGKGYVTTHGSFQPFVSEKDGARYIWIEPGFTWFVYHTQKVRGIDYVKGSDRWDGDRWKEEDEPLQTDTVPLIGGQGS